MNPNQIKQARQLLSLNQTEFAAQLGWTTKRNIVNLEKGDKDCTVQTALAIECLLRRASKMTALTMINSFKDFALNNNFEEIVTFCEQLVTKMSINPDELGPLLTEQHGTFYCPDTHIAKKFDFNSEDELKADIDELIGNDYLDRGLTYNKAYDLAAEQLHGLAQSFDNGFHSGDFIFVDLSEVAKNI